MKIQCRKCKSEDAKRGKYEVIELNGIPIVSRKTVCNSCGVTIVEHYSLSHIGIRIEKGGELIDVII